MASTTANSICRSCCTHLPYDDFPILLQRGLQLCQVLHILPVEASASTYPTTTLIAATPSPTTCKSFSPRVILDPDGRLVQDTREKFVVLKLEFDDMFNLSIPKYNGASGNIEAVVNAQRQTSTVQQEHPWGITRQV